MENPTIYEARRLGAPTCDHKGAEEDHGEPCDMSPEGRYWRCVRCGRGIARREFVIFDERLGDVRAKLEKLAKRARRLGVMAPELEILEQLDVDELNEKGKRTGHVLRSWRVAISGEAPKLPGWSFLATIQHLGEEGNLLRSIGDGDLPEKYRDAGPDCDHCRVHRMRRDTFVLKHEDGRIMQVGRQCLKDFLGHPNAEALAAAAEFLADLWDVGEGGEGWGGGGRRGMPTVEAYLSWVVAVLKISPWVSRKKAREWDKMSTADEAGGMMARWRRNEALRGDVVPTDADCDKAREAIAWAAELGEDGTVSDYEWNIRVVARASILPDRATGLAASIPVAWDRELGRRKERIESNHFGTVGERAVFKLTLEKIIVCDGFRGSSYLHMFRDEAGNVAKWFSSAGRLCDEGTTVTVKATVKKHDDYKGMKQTVLSRCAEHIEKPKKPRVRKAKEPKDGEPEAPAA